MRREQFLLGGERAASVREDASVGLLPPSAISFLHETIKFSVSTAPKVRVANEASRLRRIRRDSDPRRIRSRRREENGTK